MIMKAILGPGTLTDPCLVLGKLSFLPPSLPPSFSSPSPLSSSPCIGIAAENNS
jgi:hypothetical protein